LEQEVYELFCDETHKVQPDMDALTSWENLSPELKRVWFMITRFIVSQILEDVKELLFKLR
jgi:hypothetical protein